MVPKSYLYYKNKLKCLTLEKNIPVSYNLISEIFVKNSPNVSPKGDQGNFL